MENEKDLTRYYQITNSEYLIRLRRFKHWFHRYFSTSHMHGPYVSELGKTGLQFLYAYVGIMNWEKYAYPNGDGTYRQVMPCMKDLLILRTNFKFVFDVKKGYLQFCHNNGESLSEYIHQLDDAMYHAHTINPDSKILLDNANPNLLRIEFISDGVPINKDPFIMKMRWRAMKISPTDVVSILNMLYRYQYKRSLREKRKKIAQEKGNNDGKDNQE